MCTSDAAVPYEIRSSYVGLALKAILVVSIGKLGGSDSDTVAPWWRSRRDSVINLTIE